MKKKYVFVTVLAVLAALLAAPQKAPAADKEVAPAIVISIASIDEQFLDIAYIAKAMEAPLEVQLGLGFAKAMVPQGIDTSKPMGAYVTIDEDENIQQGFFVGVTDFEKALEGLKQFLPDQEDLGNGIIKVTAAGGRSIHIKQQGGWAFMAEDPAGLANLPKDPAALLGDLPKKYNIAMQLKAGNVPQELKATLIGAMKAGFEETKDQIKLQNPEAAPLVEEFGQAFLEGIEQIITQSDDLMYGIAVDQKTKSVYLDISITGKKGTQLAKDLSESNIKSRFSGFALPNAAASLNIASKLSEPDVQMILQLIQGGREEALDQADDQLQRELLGAIFQVVEKTAEGGKLDGGAVLLWGDKPGSRTLAFGAHIADGKALDKTLRKLARQAPRNGPKIRIEAAKYGGVVFHSATFPIPDRERAREFLGDTAELTVGTSDDSVYVAIGNDTIATLKKVIDASKKNKDKTSPPLQLTISAAAALDLIASIDGNEDLKALAESLHQFQGKDKLSLSMSSIKRGTRVRLELEEGAILAIGKLIQQVIQERGFPGLPPNALETIR